MIPAFVPVAQNGCSFSQVWPKTHTSFGLGDHVCKIRGSQWHGRIVGWYSTQLTPEGYAVESEREPGSVQIYPASALVARVADGVEVDAVDSWRSMETAPRDGTPIQARIPGNGEDNIIAWMSGFLNSSEHDCCAWAFIEDQEPPDCWTDGVCWEFNEDGNKSVEPVAWKPLISVHA